MKKQVMFLIVLTICGFAYMVRAGNMSLDLGLDLGAGGGSLCGTGFTQLTGSDSNLIYDSGGNAICCPD